MDHVLIAGETLLNGDHRGGVDSRLRGRTYAKFFLFILTCHSCPHLYGDKLRQESLRTRVDSRLKHAGTTRFSGNHRIMRE